MRRRSLAALAAAAGWLSVSANAFAAEAEHGQGGLPQLNPATFASQLFWAGVLFLVLYLLMSKVALPRVGAVLDDRNRRIGDDLDQATRMQQEAEAALAEYEQALSRARAEAQSIISTLNEELARTAATSQHALGAEIASQTREAEVRIDAARKGAMDQVRGIAAETVRAAASRLAGTEIDAARADAAVQAVAQERG